MKQVASLQYGVIFKKAFCDVEVFKGFVKAVLGIDLEIDTVETEKSFDPVIGNVDLRFDLYAQDTKNRVVVDIQHKKNSDHYDRFLHYHCAAILEQISKARNYRPPLKVFTIVVLTSGDKHQKDVLTIDFDPKDADGNGVNEIPHKIIYLCPKYANEKTPAIYKEWLDAIQDTLDGQVEESNYHEALIQKIFNAIENDHVSPTERARMFDEFNDEEYKQTAFAEGIEKGIEKGITKGLAEGELKAKFAIAEGMLAKGLDLQTISELTGLTQIEIENLQHNEA
jgi:predicted transposase/invertase (TIGR01784 family)